MLTDPANHSSSSCTRPASVLLFLGAFLRIVSYFLSKNAGGDAAGRLALTAGWLQHPTFSLIFQLYPPGHFWLIAAPNVVVAGRLLSLVLGIASVFLVWKLARLLYGEVAGMLSLAVFAFYSMHIGYSTTSSSEVPYVFFLLVGLSFFFLYFQEGSDRLRYMALSGFALSMAGSIRFEAWIVFGELVLLFGFLSYRGQIQRGLHSIYRPLLVFGTTGGAWPAVMMTYCWRRFGDPLYLITSTHLRMAKVLALTASPLTHELALIPTALLITLSPLAFVAAIYGIARSRHFPLAAGFASVTLFFGAIQSYEILRGGFLAVARYSLTLGAMLSVISGYGLEQICASLFPRRVKLAQTAAVLFLLVNLGAVLAISEIPNRFADNVAPLSPRLRYSTRIESVGAYLRAHMGPQEAVVIDDYNVESNIIADAAGLPLLRSQRAYLVSANNQIDVHEYIRTEHPRFLVYSDQGTLRSSFALPRECSQTAELDGMHFHCVFANRIYRVYELSYP
jgi:4-amino-4-deoxy-L-arabinose transferase-like glycosyltransferase